MEMVKYVAKDGIEIALDFKTVQNYLVSGKKELVTPQEVMFFLGICKSKGLNPFKKDVYLVKYDNSPAAVVTSIDYYRSRAKAQKDCRGWAKGIIVKRDGLLVYSKGLMLEGDELLGGWFKARPEGWEVDFELEVNLAGFVKKRSDGSLTQFWTKEKQPAMIMKVAESQGLRTCWPDEFQGIIGEDEMTPEDFTQTIEADYSLDTCASGSPGPGPEILIPQQNAKIHKPFDFDQLLADAAKDGKLLPGSDLKLVNEYMKASAAKHKVKKETVKLQLAKRFDEFLRTFPVFCARRKEEEKRKVEKETKGKAGKEQKANPEDPVTNTVEFKDCPDKGAQVAVDLCPDCTIRMGCPAWKEEDSKGGA